MNKEIIIKDNQIKQLEEKVDDYYRNWIQCFNEMEKYKELYRELIDK